MKEGHGARRELVRNVFATVLGAVILWIVPRLTRAMGHLIMTAGVRLAALLAAVAVVALATLVMSRRRFVWFLAGPLALALLVVAAIPREPILPDVSTRTEFRILGQSTWLQEGVARPADIVEVLISFTSLAEGIQRILVGNNLPPYFSYIQGSTELVNAANPTGIVISSDSLTTGGIDVGRYSQGANGFVRFRARIASEDEISCGQTEYRNVGVVRPVGKNEYYNTVIVRVLNVTGTGRDCLPTTSTRS